MLEEGRGGIQDEHSIVNISSFVGFHPLHNWQYYFKHFDFSLFHLERVFSATYCTFSGSFEQTMKRRRIHSQRSGGHGFLSSIDFGVYPKFLWHSLFEQTTLRLRRIQNQRSGGICLFRQEQAVEASSWIVLLLFSDLDEVEFCDQPKCRIVTIGDSVNKFDHTLNDKLVFNLHYTSTTHN